MSILIDMTLRTFSALLSRGEAAPGGGSAAALASLLGASLSLMTAKLSFGKKSYEALDEKTRAAFEEDFRGLEGLYGEVQNLIDEDTQAYMKVMYALKLPKETPHQRSEREKMLASANLEALNVPMKVAEVSLEILRRQKLIASRGNKNAASDIGVGAIMAFAGLEGALLNVKTNLPGIPDTVTAQSAADKAGRIAEEGAKLRAQILDTVNDRMG